MCALPGPGADAAGDRCGGLEGHVRKGHGDAPPVLVVLNFTPVVRRDYWIGVPQPGPYREVFNSDSRFYGGSDVGNGPLIDSQPVPWMGHENSLSLTLPPLGAIILKVAGDGR